jgi:hypothetical protein
VSTALAAFRQRRVETLDLFGKLLPGQWDKGAIHPVHGTHHDRRDSGP